jgi:hypothetical protein
MQYND